MKKIVTLSFYRKDFVNLIVKKVCVKIHIKINPNAMSCSLIKN